jgi:propanol-preferring alcohol dehydrogenase
MKAAILEKITNLKVNKEPLKITEVSEPVIGESHILVKVSVCGVCHTELDEIEEGLHRQDFRLF